MKLSGIKIYFNKEVSAPINKMWTEKVVFACAQEVKEIRGEVEINLVSPQTIKKINYKYRGQNVITDVLSFAWREEKFFSGPMLGQIYLCYERIKKQAKEWQVSAQEECARMLVHGLLHLVGFDHTKHKDAEKMFSLQEKIVKELDL